jgi:ABC-type nitrate/sulfonate/bicarbonate transport system substrate-binding protein
MNSQMILRVVCGPLFLLLFASASFATRVYSAETFRVAYPSLGPGSTPCWVTVEAGIWRKHGLDVEPILLSGGARTVPALLGGSVQMVLGSDVAVTQGILQGIALTKLGTTMNSLGYSLVTRPEIQTGRDLKGKTLGISRGRDASYARLVKILRDQGLNPNEDVKFLSIGGNEAGRLSALKAGIIHGTMFSPPMDLIASREGLKALVKVDVAILGGGLNTTTTFLRQNRKTLVNFLKGYMEGIQYMVTHKQESLRVFAKYFKSSDATAMSYLYEEITARVEKGLRPNPESTRFIYELVSAEDPRAKQLGEKDHWDLSLIDEIRQSGFFDHLYKK